MYPVRRTKIYPVRRTKMLGSNQHEVPINISSKSAVRVSFFLRILKIVVLSLQCLLATECHLIEELYMFGRIWIDCLRYVRVFFSSSLSLSLSLSSMLSSYPHNPRNPYRIHSSQRNNHPFCKQPPVLVRLSVGNG